jgi:hypothetical protein
MVSFGSVGCLLGLTLLPDPSPVLTGFDTLTGRKSRANRILKPNSGSF